jgi:hypothetical protein
VTPRRRSSASSALWPPLPPTKRAVNTSPLNVGEGRCRGPVGGDRGTEGAQDRGAGDPDMGREGQNVAGVAGWPGQDLGVLATASG